jgi:hypothetical protein
MNKQIHGNQAWHYLPPEHPWRTQEYAYLYDGHLETRPPPLRMTADEVITYGRLRQEFMDHGGTPKSADPTRLYRENAWLNGSVA